MYPDPRKMTTPQLIQRIAQLRQMIDKGLDPVHGDFYRKRLCEYEDIIKERGTQ